MQKFVPVKKGGLEIAGEVYGCNSTRIVARSLTGVAVVTVDVTVDFSLKPALD